MIPSVFLCDKIEPPVKARISNLQLIPGSDFGFGLVSELRMTHRTITFQARPPASKQAQQWLTYLHRCRPILHEAKNLACIPIGPARGPHSTVFGSTSRGGGKARRSRDGLFSRQDYASLSALQ